MKLQELNDKIKVLEMTKAMYGDWISSKLQIGTKSAFIVERNWKFITNLKTKTSEIFELRKSPSGNEYIVGRFITTDKDEELFELILRITLVLQKSIQTSFKLSKPLYSIAGVFTNEDNRGDGIATEVYKTLVTKENIYLLSDSEQYFGARKLWSRLSKLVDLQVDIIDVNKDEIVEKNARINHGKEDWQFNDNIYRYDDSLSHIRLVLKDIK